MNRGMACLEIVEQPQQRGMRFRYECEGRSAGSIPGENTTPDRKTWPACQVTNCSSMAIIRVSLVSKDEPFQPHPHSLVGRDCSDGVCQITVDPTCQMQGVFPNLGIQCVRKKEVSKAIYERLDRGVNPFNVSMEADERSAADVDLSIVRLCFEAFLPDQHGNYIHKLKPVVSNPIYDKKAPASALLRICRVDKTCGSALGNDEVFLLCDKVQKEDIQVVFSHDGWEALGDFTAPDVHRQVAIVFRTPAYRDKHIQTDVKVEVRLRRLSDRQTSAPLEFIYKPLHRVDSQNKIFPSQMTSTFGPSDPKRKNIRRAVEERARKSQNNAFNASKMSRVVKRPYMKSSAVTFEHPPSSSFSQPPPIAHNQHYPPMEHTIPYGSMSVRPNINDIPGPSGVHMPIKPEPHFGHQLGMPWSQQKLPFPSSQPQQAAPAHSYATENYMEPSRLLMNNIQDLSHSQIDAQQCDSFASLGAEGTSQILEHVAAAPINFDNSTLRDDNIDDLADLVDRHCSFEKDEPPSLQPVTRPHDVTLTGMTNRPHPPPSADVYLATSPHPSVMMSPSSVHYPSSIASPIQQFPQTPMSFHDQSTPVLSPQQVGLSQQPGIPVSMSDFGFQLTPQQSYNFHGNNNNNNQQRTTPGMNLQQDPCEDFPLADFLQ